MSGKSGARVYELQQRRICCSFKRDKRRSLDKTLSKWYNFDKAKLPEKCCFSGSTHRDGAVIFAGPSAILVFCLLFCTSAFPDRPTELLPFEDSDFLLESNSSICSNLLKRGSKRSQICMSGNAPLAGQPAGRQTQPLRPTDRAPLARGSSSRLEREPEGEREASERELKTGSPRGKKREASGRAGKAPSRHSSHPCSESDARTCILQETRPDQESSRGLI